MISRTLDELLADVAAQMQAWIGNNPLANAVVNRSNPLVKLVTAVLRGQVDLEKRLAAFKNLSNLNNLSGEFLTYAAGKKCIERKVCVKTKYLITVWGDDCAVLPQGAALIDAQGRSWTVSESITLSGNGTLCASGTGTVESSECGCWIVDIGTLSLDGEHLGISSATNSFLLEKGGEEESDEALINRIYNKGPLANIAGTADNAIAALAALDGVDFVRTYQGDLCGESGFMFIVHGGNDADICETIKLKSGSACNLLGDTECSADCYNSVRFQKACPVKLCIEILLNKDCPRITKEQATAMIMTQAKDLAYKSKLSGAMLSKLHPDIEDVKLSIKKPPLFACDEMIIDPITGDEVNFGNQECGLCVAKSECIGDPVYSGTVSLQPWQYPILTAEQITFRECEAAEAVEC